MDKAQYNIPIKAETQPTEDGIQTPEADMAPRVDEAYAEIHDQNYDLERAWRSYVADLNVDLELNRSFATEKTLRDYQKSLK